MTLRDLLRECDDSDLDRELFFRLKEVGPYTTKWQHFPVNSFTRGEKSVVVGNDPPPEAEHPGVCIVRDATGNIIGIGKKG